MYDGHANLPMMNVKVSPGDVFRFGDRRSGWGCGQVLLSGNLIYVEVFEPIFRSKHVRLDEIVTSHALLSGWTMDARVQSGAWEILGNADLNPTATFPEYQIEITGKIWVTNTEGKPLRLATIAEQRLLPRRTSHSPIAYEKAFWAFHSGSWEGRFDELLTRNSH